RLARPARRVLTSVPTSMMPASTVSEMAYSWRARRFSAAILPAMSVGRAMMRYSFKTLSSLNQPSGLHGRLHPFLAGVGDFHQRQPDLAVALAQQAGGVFHRGRV